MSLVITLFNWLLVVLRCDPSGLARGKHKAFSKSIGFSNFAEHASRVPRMLQFVSIVLVVLFFLTVIFLLLSLNNFIFLLGSVS